EWCSWVSSGSCADPGASPVADCARMIWNDAGCGGAGGPELWRHDHTHGTLTSHVGDHEGTMTLSDHPYTTTPLARSSIAEIYRYAVSLARAKHVSSRHLVRGPNQLEVKLSWG